MSTNAEGNNTVRFQDAVAFWQNAVTISDYQGQVIENWLQWFPHGFMLAPAQLWQKILTGWVFGTQVNVYKTRSSNAAAEERIVTDIAGYGSQLGTIQDYLKIIQKHVDVQEETLDTKEKEAVKKFNKLVEDVNRAKDLASAKKSTVGAAPAAKPVLVARKRGTQLAQSKREDL